MFLINYNFREVTLSKEAHIFKTMVKAKLPPCQFKDNALLRIEVEFHSNWYYKKGKIKKHDGDNLEKLLKDAIAEGLGISDSQFFEWQGRKVQDTESYTIVNIREI